MYDWHKIMLKNLMDNVGLYFDIYIMNLDKLE